MTFRKHEDKIKKYCDLLNILTLSVIQKRETFSVNTRKIILGNNLKYKREVLLIIILIWSDGTIILKEPLDPLIFAI